MNKREVSDFLVPRQMVARHTLGNINSPAGEL
jgi:hypothetical protein